MIGQTYALSDFVFTGEFEKDVTDRQLEVLADSVFPFPGLRYLTSGSVD